MTVDPLALVSHSNKSKMIHRRALGSRRLWIYIALLVIVVGILTIIRLVTQMRLSFGYIHYASDTDFELVTLPQSFAFSRGARCLDGSPPAYYYRAGAGSSAFWIIHLLAGAWCENAEHCYKRSFTPLGSSKLAPTSITRSGLFSKDCNSNPQFCSWNVAMFLYCDGSSFLGNMSSPLTHESTKLYRRGALNFDAVLEYLLLNTELRKAEQVILTGSSAGGIAALIHADRLRTRLPPSVHSLHVVVDASMFVDEPDIKGKPHLANLFHSMYDFHNVKDAESIQECTKRLRADDAWKCLFVGTYHTFVFTPVFYINSVYDVWQREHALRVPCFEDTCPDDHIESVNSVRDAVHRLAHAVIKSPKNSIFLTHCPAHGLLDRWTFFELRVGQRAMNESLASWLLHSKGQGDIKSPLNIREGLAECGSYRHNWSMKHKHK